MRWIVGWIIHAVILMGISYFFDGFHIAGFGTALLASVLLSIVNLIVKPILILFTLPITILTLGLFLFVVNALTLMLTAFLMGNSFVIDGFGMALLAAVPIALVQTFIVKPLRNS